MLCRFGTLRLLQGLKTTRTITTWYCYYCYYFYKKKPNYLASNSKIAYLNWPSLTKKHAELAYKVSLFWLLRPIYNFLSGWFMVMINIETRSGKPGQHNDTCYQKYFIHKPCLWYFVVCEYMEATPLAWVELYPLINCCCRPPLVVFQQLVGILLCKTSESANIAYTKPLPPLWSTCWCLVNSQDWYINMSISYCELCACNTPILTARLGLSYSSHTWIAILVSSHYLVSMLSSKSSP